MSKLFSGHEEDAPDNDLFSSGFMAFLDSTAVAPNDRLTYWKENLRPVNGVEIICATPNFVGQMTTRKLGMCSVHGVQIDTAHKAVRVRKESDLCFVNIQLRNDGARFNGHREFEIPEGAMVLY